MKFGLSLVFFFYMQMSWAFTPPAFIPNVVDETNILSETEIKTINEDIQKLREGSNVLAAVYMVKTLGATTIEDAAYQTFQTWKLGSAEKQNGLLFIFAIDDRNARIEVGSGLEGDVTDLHAKRLLDNVILPYFKNDLYAEGIKEGLNTVSLIINKQPLPEGWENSTAISSDELNTARGFKVYSGWLVLLYIVTPLLIILSRLAKRPTALKKVGVVNGKPIYKTDTKAKEKLNLSNLVPIFLILFFTINPGLFIFFGGAIDGIYNFCARAINNLADSGMLIPTVVTVFLLPIVTKFVAINIGRENKNMNPDCYREFPSSLIFLLNLHQPAIPVSLASAAVCILIGLAILGLNAILAGLIIGSTVFIYGLILLNMVKLLVSPIAYQRHMARERLNRIKTRAYGTREIFGKTYTFTKSSSSSSSSSRSGGFSSSSGGGRSSGGGASSRW